jgi:hypothetical protein
VKLKSKQCWIKFIFRDINDSGPNLYHSNSCICLFLLQEIATAESDRVAVVASPTSGSVWNSVDRGTIMISTLLVIMV